MTSKQTRRSTMIQLLAMGTVGTVPDMSSGQSVDQAGSEGKPMNANHRLYSFIGGETGIWRATSQRTVSGEGLAGIGGLTIVSGNAADMYEGAKWILQGVTSNERYVTRKEKETLLAKQQGLGRSDSNCGVLIPIRKNSTWWSLTQDERRHIFEGESRHNAIGLEYLPAIARRLHHCRDLPESQPFDFLTWFEFAEEHTEQFNKLLERLRASKEWGYVDREQEFRFRRDVSTEVK